jgi:hypothetical protein
MIEKCILKFLTSLLRLRMDRWNIIEWSGAEYSEVKWDGSEWNKYFIPLFGDFKK